jgi:hypothetical protein
MVLLNLTSDGELIKTAQHQSGDKKVWEIKFLADYRGDRTYLRRLLKTRC